MKYNCPDCNLNLESCDGCHRIHKESEQKKYKDYNEYIKDLVQKFKNTNIVMTDNVFRNDPYEHCLNNPKNGGSGICNCTLGLKTFYW